MDGHWFDSRYFRAVAAVSARCPACDTEANTTASVRLQSAPRDGDLSLCRACGAASQWVDGATRLATVDESTLDDADRANITRGREMISLAAMVAEGG